MFDFNGDGKIDMTERFLAFSIFEDMTGGESMPVGRYKKRQSILKRAYEKMEGNSYKNTTFGRAMLELISFAVMVILYFLIKYEVLAGAALVVGASVFFIAVTVVIFSAVTSLIF